MFLGFCALLIIALVPLTGGQLRKLGEIKLRWIPLAVVALVIQVLVITVWPQMPHGLAVGGHLATYLMLGAVVWANRAVPGMVVIAVGAGLNAMAIAVNDGTLPASAHALHEAGIKPRDGFQNSGILAHPHLPWLGDIMVTPSWLPLRNMLSIGDLVLLAGAVILVLRVTHSRVAEGEDGLDVADVGTPGLEVPGGFPRGEVGVTPQLVGEALPH
jgi:Family of unknown function (DUF5317)